MSELRWWLLILGVAFFAALTFWELRRPRQARPRAAPPEATRTREPPLQLPEMHAVESLTGRTLPVVELPDDTGTFPVLEAAPPEAGSDGGGDPAAVAAAPDEQGAAATAAEAAPAHEEAPVEAGFEVSPESSPSDEPYTPGVDGPLVEWPRDEERRVVALRLVAAPPERFAGRSLRQALAAEGFVLGRFDIFHKPDEAQRVILSAASLTRPGTFDADTMDSQHFGGLSLFAVLPGPMSPPEAFEELVTTARHLNDRLCGVLQDEGGTPLTPARIATLRERLASGMLS
jgi:cell division protein ZipA